MSDWLADYADTDDANERYRLLRDELARLRGGAEEGDFYDRAAVAEDVARLNDGFDGDLIVFVANDFGLPVAYRPKGTGFEVQDAVRRAVLETKYDGANDDLDGARRTLLDRHPAVHKVLVAAVDGASIRYHLPEGSNEDTNFLTVREMVGLVDYTTNSQQNEGLSTTY